MDAFLPNGIFTDTHVILLQEIRSTVRVCGLSHFSRVWLFCKPMDCSLPGSSVHGVSQARVLERVAIFFSKGSSLTRDQTPISCIGRRTLYHCATWEVLLFIMLSIINKN